MSKKKSEMTKAEHQRKIEGDRRRRKKKKIVGGSVEEAAADVVQKVQDLVERKLTSQELEAIGSGERRRIFLRFLHEYDGNVAAACVATGITRNTYNVWLHKYPEMQMVCEELTEALLDLAEQQLLKNIVAGKENSLFFFLCNKGKHRGWRDIRKLSGAQLNKIDINVKYPDGTKLLPPVDVEVTEVKPSASADRAKDNG